MSNRTLTGLVKRLYKINEIRQIRSDLGFAYAPTTTAALLTNCVVHPITFPIPLASGLSTESDSTFEGNSFLPIALKIRLQLSMNGGPMVIDPARGSSNYTYGGWVRVIVYQVKAGRAFGQTVSSNGYHELAGEYSLNTDAAFLKARILGSPATTDVASLVTNYHNEPTSPLRVGIRSMARILADKRFTFSSHGRQAIATRFRTRKPSEVKYVENPAVYNSTDDGNEVTIPVTPSNQIYIMYIMNFDQATVTNLGVVSPQLMVAANYELVYRDA